MSLKTKAKKMGMYPSLLRYIRVGKNEKIK
jgi:hypothetical protein